MRTPRKDSLWGLIAGPAIWSVFFLTVYVAAAVRCAKAETPMADLTGVRVLIAVLALAALAAIGAAGVGAWRRWRSGNGARPPHDDDTRQSRQQFLALATLLLCGVSVVATIFVALPALFIGSCR